MTLQKTLSTLAFLALLSILVPFACAADADRVQVKVFFPADAKQADIDRLVPLSSCPSAYTCYAQISFLSCQWYAATGPLACPGLPEVKNTCLLTAVNGYSGAGWFGFYANGNLSEVGISCYVPKVGDVLELRYSGNPESEVSNATPAPSATPSPSPTPAPSITASPKQTITPTPAATPSPKTANQSNSTGAPSPTPYVFQNPLASLNPDAIAAIEVAAALVLAAVAGAIVMWAWMKRRRLGK
ncbi:MAG: hypothetical protein NTY90_00365 [Candidatus Micrarchaeota archaeon]|nr:hypothetical protein [Candidatus Micrarchaeota archaeon]